MAGSFCSATRAGPPSRRLAMGSRLSATCVPPTRKTVRRPRGALVLKPHLRANSQITRASSRYQTTPVSWCPRLQPQPHLCQRSRSIPSSAAAASSAVDVSTASSTDLGDARGCSTLSGPDPFVQHLPRSSSNNRRTAQEIGALVAPAPRSPRNPRAACRPWTISSTISADKGSLTHHKLHITKICSSVSTSSSL